MWVNYVRACCLVLQGICCQIMSLPASLLQNPPEDDAGNTWQYPPTAFTYMARDQHTAHGVQEMTSVLVQQVCFGLCA